MKKPCHYYSYLALWSFKWYQKPSASFAIVTMVLVYIYFSSGRMRRFGWVWFSPGKESSKVEEPKALAKWLVRIATDQCLRYGANLWMCSCAFVQLTSLRCILSAFSHWRCTLASSPLISAVANMPILIDFNYCSTPEHMSSITARSCKGK